MKNRNISVIVLLLFTLPVCTSYAQHFKIVKVEKIPLDETMYSLKMEVKITNDSNLELFIPNVIKQKGDFIAVSNVSSMFFTLQSTDDVFAGLIMAAPPQGAEYPKLEKHDIIFVKPHSSATFEMNTSYFDSNGFLLKSNKKARIKLIYQPDLKELENYRNEYLDEEIIDVKFYEKQIVSNTIEI